MKAFTWILDRARERSTWLGVTTFLTMVGVALTPEQKEAVALAGVAIGGLVLTFTKDKLPKE